MHYDTRNDAAAARPTLSRRTLIRRGAAGAAGVALAGDTGHALGGAAATSLARPYGAAGAADPAPRPAMAGLLAALDRYQLVAMAERHFVQEWHDLITALLFHPRLSNHLTDIVIEAGCAAYQDLADRFIVTGQPVARADLAQIWRQVATPGGMPRSTSSSCARCARSIGCARPSAASACCSVRHRRP
jgi:hypothetical protein